MHQLKLFSSPTLASGDVVLTGRPVQRHRIALLSLLALSPGRRMSRDKLIAFLWPERDTESGRNLLKAATYVLRAELGERALLSENDGLRLNEQVVQTDAAAFEEDVARLDYERAVQWYRGSFLDGFFLSDAPEFEHWAEQERTRLANEYAGALEKLALAAEAALDFATAVERWKKRAAYDPYDARIALRLIQALDASGNPAAGIQHAAIHQRLTQEEFGIATNAELEAVVAQLRSRTPTPAAATSTAPEDAIPPTALLPDRSPPRRSRWLRALVPASVLLLLATFFLTARSHSSGDEASIAVLPFANQSGDADDEYFSDGLTEEVIIRLSALDGLKVISRTSAMHYKLNRKPMRDVARELNVRHVLEGSVRRRGDVVRITAQLIDAEKDEHIWADSYDYSLHDSFYVQEQIARAVAEVLEVELGARQTRQLTRRGTNDAEAYELYRRSRFLWNTRTPKAHEQAAQYLRHAIAADPRYADAYALLGQIYATSHQLGFSTIPEAEVYARITASAEHALALDDASADAHTALAVVFWYQRNWQGVEREMRRAIELNPGNADARTWYSLLLGGMGRLDEALAQARRAYEVDPFALVISLDVGWACYLLRDYTCAADQFRRTLELNPSWGLTYMRHGMTLAQAGRLSAAVDTLRRGLEQAPNYVDLQLSLAYAYALADSASAARELLERAKTRARGIGPAFVHIALNEPDSAFAWLDRADWRFAWTATLYDPALDPLRHDPRFVQLAARVRHEMGLR